MGPRGHPMSFLPARQGGPIPWFDTRQAILGTFTRATLEATVGRPSLTTGVFMADQALLAAQVAAESAGHWPPVVALPPEVWTDGSCTHPRDPLLRRAAWAVVGSPPGYLTLGSAMVIGRQTIGRAELSALVWVSMCGGAAAIIDAQYLIGCMARCAGGSRRMPYWTANMVTCGD